jgi:hypothetical protein
MVKVLCYKLNGAGSNPNEVIGFVSIYLVALGLTQPLTEMSTKNLPGGKAHGSHRYL